MKEKIISRLVSIKSIVTLTLTLVFAYLSVRGFVPTQDFMSVFLIIIGFYFGTQNAKTEPEIEKGESNGKQP